MNFLALISGLFKAKPAPNSKVQLRRDVQVELPPTGSGKITISGQGAIWSISGSYNA